MQSVTQGWIFWCCSFGSVFLAGRRVSEARIRLILIQVCLFWYFVNPKKRTSRSQLVLCFGELWFGPALFVGLASHSLFRSHIDFPKAAGVSELRVWFLSSGRSFPTRQNLICAYLIWSSFTKLAARTLFPSSHAQYLLVWFGSNGTIKNEPWASEFFLVLHWFCVCALILLYGEKSSDFVGRITADIITRWNRNKHRNW